MCNPITIDFISDPEVISSLIANEVTSAGGSINETADGGAFEVGTVIGTFNGIYTMSAQQIEITVTHKPFLISCNRIEGEVRHRFEGL